MRKLTKIAGAVGSAALVLACRLEDTPCSESGADKCSVGGVNGVGGDANGAGGDDSGSGGQGRGGHRASGGRSHSGGSAVVGGRASGGAHAGGSEHESGGSVAWGGEPEGVGGLALGGDPSVGGDSTGGTESGGATTGGESSGGGGTGGAGAAPRQCPPGQIISEDASSCSFCSPGTYSETFDAHFCAACPEGSTSALGAERCGPIVNCDWAGNVVDGNGKLRSLRFEGERLGALAFDKLGRLVLATQPPDITSGPKPYSRIRVRRFDVCGAVISSSDIPIPGKNPPPNGSRIPEPSVGAFSPPMLIDSSNNIYFIGISDKDSATGQFASYVMKVPADGDPEWVVQWGLGLTNPKLRDFDPSGNVQVEFSPKERVLISPDGLSQVRGPWPHGRYSLRDWAGNEYTWESPLSGSGESAFLTVWAKNGTFRRKGVFFWEISDFLLDPQTGVVARAGNARWSATRDSGEAVFLDTGPAFLSTDEADHLGTFWSTPLANVCSLPKFGPSGLWMLVEYSAVQIAVGGTELQAVPYSGPGVAYYERDVAVDELGNAFIIGEQRQSDGTNDAVLYRVAAAMTR